MPDSRQRDRGAHAHDPLSPTYETFLTFERPLPCLVCDALTQWGHLQHATSRQFVLEAYCPQHGFAQRIYTLGEYGTYTPLELQEQRKSVVRFVVAMHGGQRSAQVLASMRPELATGYHVWQRDDFASEDDYQQWHQAYAPRAWSVRYVAPADVAPTYFIVVYDEEYTQLHLCAEDGSCRPPQHLPEDEQDEQEDHP